MLQWEEIGVVQSVYQYRAKVSGGWFVIWGESMFFYAVHIERLLLFRSKSPWRPRAWWRRPSATSSTSSAPSS